MILEHLLLLFLLVTPNLVSSCTTNCACPNRETANCNIDSPGPLQCSVQVKILSLQLSVRGNPKYMFKLCNSVEQVVIKSNQYIKTINKDILLGLNDLQSLTIESGPINSLKTGVLNSTKKLARFALHGNKLELLSADVFNSCARLQFLDLTSNNIKFIEDGTFGQCEELKSLYIGGNQISTLSGSTLHGLKNLRELYASDNKISELTDFSFVSVYTLEILVLNNNKLSIISDNTFVKLYTLQSLRLSNNHIVYISLNAFRDMNALKVVDLSGNPLGTLSWSMFQHQPSLAMLQLGQDIHCVIEVGRAPSAVVREAFSKYPHCSGVKRTSRVTTAIPMTLPSTHSPGDEQGNDRTEDKVDQSSLLQTTGPSTPNSKEVKHLQEPIIRFIDQVPYWMVLLTCVTSMGFLVTLVILVVYCNVTRRQVRNLKCRSSTRSTPLPLLIHRIDTDDEYLATEI